MDNRVIWRAEDIWRITGFIILLFGLVFLCTLALKKFLDLQAPILTLIIDSGLVLSIITTYFVYTRKKGFGYLDLGFIDVNKKWMLLSVIAGLFVVFIGGGLSTLLSKLLSLDMTNSLMEQNALSNKLWLDLLNFKLLIGILIPISEEIYFRGVLFKYFREKYKFLYAGTLSALIFSIFHFSFVLLPFTFILGFTSAYMFEKTQSIIPSFFVHIIANTIAVNTLLMSLYLS
jgi:uncharacterized protein